MVSCDPKTHGLPNNDEVETTIEDKEQIDRSNEAETQDARELHADNIFRTGMMYECRSDFLLAKLNYDKALVLYQALRNEQGQTVNNCHETIDRLDQKITFILAMIKTIDITCRRQDVCRKLASIKERQLLPEQKQMQHSSNEANVDKPTPGYNQKEERSESLARDKKKRVAFSRPIKARKRYPDSVPTNDQSNLGDQKRCSSEGARTLETETSSYYSGSTGSGTSASTVAYHYSMYIPKKLFRILLCADDDRSVVSSGSTSTDTYSRYTMDSSYMSENFDVESVELFFADEATRVYDIYPDDDTELSLTLCGVWEINLNADKYR